LTSICTKSFVCGGSAPDPTKKAYRQRSPNLLAVFRGLLLKKEEEGTGGKRERKEEKERKSGGLCP